MQTCITYQCPMRHVILQGDAQYNCGRSGLEYLMPAEAATETQSTPDLENQRPNIKIQIDKMRTIVKKEGQPDRQGDGLQQASPREITEVPASSTQASEKLSAKDKQSNPKQSQADDNQISRNSTQSSKYQAQSYQEKQSFDHFDVKRRPFSLHYSFSGKHLSQVIQQLKYAVIQMDKQAKVWTQSLFIYFKPFLDFENLTQIARDYMQKKFIDNYQQQSRQQSLLTPTQIIRRFRGKPQRLKQYFAREKQDKKILQWVESMKGKYFSWVQQASRQSYYCNIGGLVGLSIIPCNLLRLLSMAAVSRMRFRSSVNTFAKKEYRRYLTSFQNIILKPKTYLLIPMLGGAGYITGGLVRSYWAGLRRNKPSQ